MTSEIGFSPNCGSKCFSTICRWFFWVDALYIGRTWACHSCAIVSNVTREHVGVRAPVAAATLRPRISFASLRDIVERSYRNTRFILPSERFRAPASESPTPFRASDELAAAAIRLKMRSRTLTPSDSAINVVCDRVPNAKEPVGAFAGTALEKMTTPGS